MKQTARQRKRLSTVAAVVGLAGAGCGSVTPPATPAPAAQAYLISIDQLAAGKLGTLPTGGEFARIQVFVQDPGTSFPSRTHQPGFDYVAEGVQRLQLIDGETVDIQAGTAAFQRSIAHSHVNPGTLPNRWYFLGLIPSALRGQPPVVATAREVFASEDIPQSALSSVSYVETLRRMTLKPSGRSAAHRFAGLEVVFVLDGALAIDVAGRAPIHLTADEGAYVNPNTVTQEVAAGGSTVHYLAFFVTAEGMAFETDVDTPPPG